VSLTPQQKANVWTIAEAAVACQIATGLPACISTAQAIYESDYLARSPQNNCFGIKTDGHGSGSQAILTHEFLDGTWHEMLQAFETYATLADCFADHARLIQSGVYAPVWEAYEASGQTSADLDQYIRGIAQFYATDPAYAQEITAEAHSATVQNALVKAISALDVSV
jgi:flagellum-specific peptidoglycan hydrolase FlgJ